VIFWNINGHPEAYQEWRHDNLQLMRVVRFLHQRVVSTYETQCLKAGKHNAYLHIFERAHSLTLTHICKLDVYAQGTHSPHADGYDDMLSEGQRSSAHSALLPKLPGLLFSAATARKNREQMTRTTLREEEREEKTKLIGRICNTWAGMI
jgi:hypothetical protein